MNKSMILIASAICMMSLQVSAHEWNADEWAKNQVTLAAEMVNCAELIKIDIEQFAEECDKEDLKFEDRLDQRFERSQVALEEAIMGHTGMAVVDIQDIIVDFKDHDLGLEALESLEQTNVSLEYIIYKIQAAAYRKAIQKKKLNQFYI